MRTSEEREALVTAAFRKLDERYEWQQRSPVLARIAVAALAPSGHGDYSDRQMQAIQGAAEALRGIYPNEFADNFYFYQQAKGVIDAYLSAAREEPQGEICETCQARRGIHLKTVLCWGPRDCIGMSDQETVEGTPA